jgi:hypothetical protein
LDADIGAMSVKDMKASTRLFWAVGVVLAASASSARANQLVPFVGCPGDVQLMQDFPAFDGRPVSVDVGLKAAQNLAFYGANPGEGIVGVLAPRGWSCYWSDTSGGFQLLVDPDAKTSLFSLGNTQIYGVWLNTYYGGTSGRFAVADFVKTYFPSLDSYVSDTLDEEKQQTADMPAGVVSNDKTPTPDNGIPYPRDIILDKGSSTLDFMTPGGSEGLGKLGFVSSAMPIYGILDIDVNEDHLAPIFAVRLPENLDYLRPSILKDQRILLKKRDNQQ